MKKSDIIKKLKDNDITLSLTDDQRKQIADIFVEYWTGDSVICPYCGNPYPRLLSSGRWYCDECEVKWK